MNKLLKIVKNIEKSNNLQYNNDVVTIKVITKNQITKGIQENRSRYADRGWFSCFNKCKKMVENSVQTVYNNYGFRFEFLFFGAKPSSSELGGFSYVQNLTVDTTEKSG